MTEFFKILSCTQMQSTESVDASTPVIQHVRMSSFAVRLIFAAGIFAGLGCYARAEDFTFVHATDIHAPMPQSAATIARIKALGPLELSPFSTSVPKPSFIIATGDLTEFGGGSGWWNEYMGYWKDCSIPVHHQLGNHDNTWHANINFIRSLGRPTHYSFDAHGCHFVSLMTPTPQDPRPSISEEQLVWLRSDLEKVGADRPVVVFFHHPLGGNEFASRYDYDRLLDLLRRHNTVLLLAGHSHGYVSKSIGGIDQITGGSTFGPNAGFSVLSVKESTLRAAYWKVAEASPGTALIEKVLPERCPYINMEISSPALREVTGDNLGIYARLGAKPDDKVNFAIDEELGGTLMVSGAGTESKALGRPSLTGLLPGAHYLRIDFTSGGKPVSKSTHFFYEPAARPTAWRAYLGASSKAAPASANGTVYAAAHDGLLRAFDTKSGEARWTAETGAEILANPLALDRTVIAANGAGLVIAYDMQGKKLWSFQADDAVYSSPVASGSNVVFGCNSGAIYALDASGGSLVWTNKDAGYSIESQPCVWQDRIFAGGWDQYVRCLDAATGKLVWKQKTEGVKRARGAHRYFSPGDAAPVFVDGNLLIADRAFMLSIFDARRGGPIGVLEKVAAVGPSLDGKSAYLRRTDGQLTKVDRTGKEIWSVPARLNSIPVPPTEHDGKVYVCSGMGLLSCLSATDGKLLWQYSVSPRLFVMSAVTCDSQRAYVTSFDGSLTAVNLPK